MDLRTFVEGGRLRDLGQALEKQAIRSIAENVPCEFRLTANQNLVVARISTEDKEKVENILRENGVRAPSELSALRLNSIACTALPTCGLALAESERYLPGLIDELDQIIKDLGLRDESIAIRSTGCPNGCGRPYLGEIGLVGKVSREVQSLPWGGIERHSIEQALQAGHHRMMKSYRN